MNCAQVECQRLGIHRPKVASGSRGISCGGRFSLNTHQPHGLRALCKLDAPPFKGGQMWRGGLVWGRQ